MMKTKRIAGISLAALLVAGIGTMAGCGGDTPATGSTGDVSQGGTATRMVFADTQSPTSMDPSDGWSSWYTSRYGITETLYTLDKNLSAQPLLVTDADALDDTTWVLTLRDNVTFQNGEKLTAQSVIDCWNYTMSKNARLNELLYIDSMAADGQTLTVKTKKPVPAFLSSLCEPITGIYYISGDTQSVENPIGTGPYKLVQYDVKKTCEVERYDGYWQGKPALEGAVFNIIADGNALAMAQQAGEADVSLTIPSSNLSIFRNNDQYVVDGQTGSRGQIVWFNFENEFLKDVNVRKAISMSIDKKTYAEKLNEGASTPATAFLPDSTPYGGSGLAGYDFDIEGAKKLLADAGYTDTDGDGIVDKDGKNVSLTISTYTTKAELPVFCEAMASALKEVGIELKVNTGSYDAVTELESNGNFDMLMISMTMCPTGDPQYFSDLCFKTGGSSNYGGYSNAEVDALIDQLEREFDPAKRNELAREIQQKVLDDAGYLTIGHANFTNVLKKGVENCETNPSEYYLLNYQTTMAP